MLLWVDPERLHEIGAQLIDATAVAEEIGANGEGLKAHVADCGNDDVRGAACRFLDEWAYGARCLESDGRTLADLLVGAEEAYVEIDDAVLEEWLE